MLKRLFKGFIYFLGICAFISLLATACSDEEEQTYIESTGPNEAVLVIPEEPDSEVEVVVPETQMPEVQVPDVQAPEEDFVFIEGPTVDFADAASYEFTNYITGVVKNNTDKDYEYVQISFTLYDADGNVVDTAFTNVNNLKAGGTWKFEAMFFENGVESWELDEITGW